MNIYLVPHVIKFLILWMLDCKIDHFTNFNKLKQPH